MEGKLIILPKKKPKTIGEVLDWHKSLLHECLECELEKQIIEASISKLNRLSRETIPYLKDELYKSAAKLKLKSINALLDKANEDLLFTKKKLETIYNTNETIISAVIASHVGVEKANRQYSELKNEYKGSHPNLLHGIGWMFEYACAQYWWKKGKAAFLTFGTYHDPAKIDLIVILQSPDELIELGLEYNSEQTP